MKLKFLAAAAALLCGSTAFAGINTNDGDAELFLVVWDESKATYALDTGLTLGALTSGVTVQTFSVVGSENFAAYAKEDGNLDDFTTFTGTRWAVFAVDNNAIFGIDGKDLNYLTTTTGDAKVPTSVEVVNTNSNFIADYAFTLGQNGLTPDVTKNGDIWGKLGSPVHFIELGQGGLFAGNAIGGGVQKLNFCSWDLFIDNATCVTKNSAGLNMEASFDGKTLAVTAVPEPGTYALLLAGLATVGFMARRRKV